MINVCVCERERERETINTNQGRYRRYQCTGLEVPRY